MRVTLYVKDADAPLWARAKLATTSLSALVTDALRQRIKETDMILTVRGISRHIASEDEVQPVIDAFTPTVYQAEASDLGLAPGVWPETIQHPNAGEQQFTLERIRRAGGEVISVTYRSDTGDTLVVFND